MIIFVLIKLNCILYFCPTLNIVSLFVPSFVLNYYFEKGIFLFNNNKSHGSNFIKSAIFT